MKTLLFSLVCLALRLSSGSLLKPREPTPGFPGIAEPAAFGHSSTLEADVVSLPDLRKGAPGRPRALGTHAVSLPALRKGAPGEAQEARAAYRQGLRWGLAALSTLLLAVAGWKVAGYSQDLGMLSTSKHKAQAEADGGIKHIDETLRAQLESGEIDQAWNEELGLCATQVGRERWYRRSEVDPANHLADLAKDHPAEDVPGWPGRGGIDRGAADAERSREERRIVTLHSKLLERERYVDVNFWKLLLKGKWSAEPGGYPGPAFETKAEFCSGTRRRRWPLGLEGTEDTRVCDLRGPQLAAHLRAFVWRNNSDGSLKASLIMIFLGLIPFLQNFLTGKIVEMITPPAAAPAAAGAAALLSVDLGLGMWLETRTISLVLGLCALELVSHYISFKFWTTVPKYGVLRQFQSFFGRRCLHILMAQATPKDNRLKCAHEDRFRDSPGLCQAMVNYCCEAVVLNLWGKSFDHTRAKTTLSTSLLLIVYVMAIETAAGVTSGSYLANLWGNFCHYGWCIFLFMVLSFAMFSLNVLFRVQHSVDIWGVATKTKLNMISLQQELTHRMMSTGRTRDGAPMGAADQKLLDEACSDWHDACRIYGNRDFHTWFCSWIVTDEFNNMLNSFSLMMCTMVLVLEVLGGHMSVGTFVMALGSVRSINGAFATALSYHFSMPEGYVCLLYLAQVCNMNVPGDDESDDEEVLGDDGLSSKDLLQPLIQGKL